MKRFLIFICIFAVVNVYAQNTKTDEIFDAMQQEMKRTMSLSKTAPKIHFAAFRVADYSDVSIIAARGGIVQENSRQWVNTDVSLRVGTQKEDNSFFETNTFIQSNLQDGALSTEGVRAGLWAIADKSYKDALDIYARKQGYKNKKAQEEVFDDFSAPNTAQDIKVYEKVILPLNTLKEIAQKTSAAGALSELEKFNTEIIIYDEISYYLSSEGAKYTKQDFLIQIAFYAKSRTTHVK